MEGLLFVVVRDFHKAGDHSPFILVGREKLDDDVEKEEKVDDDIDDEHVGRLAGLGEHEGSRQSKDKNPTSAESQSASRAAPTQ